MVRARRHTSKFLSELGPSDAPRRGVGDVTEQKFLFMSAWIFGDHANDPQAAQKAIETLVQVLIFFSAA